MTKIIVKSGNFLQNKISGQKLTFHSPVLFFWESLDQTFECYVTCNYWCHDHSMKKLYSFQYYSIKTCVSNSILNKRLSMTTNFSVSIHQQYIWLVQIRNEKHQDSLFCSNLHSQWLESKIHSCNIDIFFHILLRSWDMLF